MNVHPSMLKAFPGSLRAIVRERVKHGKRLVFTATLFTLITRESNMSKRMKNENLEKLHRVMALSRTKEALVFPCSLTDVVWGNNHVTDIEQGAGVEDISAIESLCQKYASLSPKWLCYELREMVEDALTVFRARQQYA